jgi:hypothetical protein
MLICFYFSEKQLMMIDGDDVEEGTGMFYPISI